MFEWHRRDYGEHRIRVLGRAEEHILFVVYTWRGDVRRIISARLVSEGERHAYRSVFG